jgi:hypothetical protein
MQQLMQHVGPAATLLLWLGPTTRIVALTAESAERDGRDSGRLIDRRDDAAHFARAAPWLRFNPPDALRASLAQQLSAARSLRFR